MKKILTCIFAVAVAVIFTTSLVNAQSAAPAAKKAPAAKAAKSAPASPASNAPTPAKKKHHKKAHHKAAVAPAPAPAPIPEPVAPPPPPTKHKKQKVTAADFPEKGWHKGPYVGVNIGIVQTAKDSHIITERNFGSWPNLDFGITFGWDIADWIGPMLQMNFSTKTAQVGDSNGGNNGGVAYASQPTFTFPAGTFPVEQSRQYQTDIGLYAKATLPYFTHAEWQPKMVKILPYAKLGAAGSALFVNSPTNANKMGAFGGGPALGVGCEFFIWKGFFAALDFTEYLIWEKSISRNITTANAGSQNFKLTKGGFNPHFSLLGIFGWHF
ncbi:MAG: outer membrane beta-barrel protein [Pseudomonadota bacterium]